MSDTTRRKMLLDSSKYLAGIGLTGMLGARAFADNKTTGKKRLTGKELAAIEAKHPAGSETVMDAKLDPHAEKIGRILLQKSRSAMALAVANPSAKFASDSLHAVAAVHAAKLSTKRNKRAKERAAKQLAAPTATKATTFGPYAKAELASATVKQSTDVELSAALREVAAAVKDPQNEVEKKHKSGDKSAGDTDEDKKDPVFTKIQFQLNSLKCLEENDTTSASDEVLIGGSIIERTGNIIKIDKMKYEDVDAGETRYFDFEPCKGMDAGMVQGFKTLGWCPHGGANDVYGGRAIGKSNLGGGGTWGLVLIMGEEDGGGFDGMLGDIYKKLKSEIEDALKGVAQAVGITVTAALTAYLGPLGTAIGAALTWALTELVEWFVGLFNNEDDMIASKTWNVKLEKRTQKYIKNLSNDNLPVPKGQWASPMKKLTFKGDGGHYELRCHWRAYA